MPAAILCFVAGMVHPAFTQRPDSPPPRPPSGSNMQFTRPLTASVSGTFLFREKQIELLVLWRGAPGWLFGAEHTRSSGSTDTYNLTHEIGTVRVDLAYDRRRRTATVNGNEISIPLPNNVVLVDGVGSSRIVTKVIAVDLTTSGNPEVASLLKRSPEIVAFLRCDVVSSHPLEARLNSLVCDGLKP